jgi:hypothetical protein
VAIGFNSGYGKHGLKWLKLHLPPQALHPPKIHSLILMDSPWAQVFPEETLRNRA